VIDSVESDPTHRVRAEVDWRTTTLLFTKPAMIGGAAAEAAARAYPSQAVWRVVDYSETKSAAHLTMLGGAWAGVTYYLAGLHFLLEKTVEHRSGVRHVVYERRPDFGQ
jgi:hypothetical protein